MKPKFKLGDVVKFKDDFSENPASKAYCIGKIEVIHVRTASWAFSKKGISYSIAGYGLELPEKKLTLWNIDDTPRK